MNTSIRRLSLCAIACGLAGTSHADSWRQRQNDVQRTGRAAFAVPSARQSAGLFDVMLWQTPLPGSPGDGNIDSSSVTFFDGAGPDGADIAVVGYHWPKGVMAVNRHTGERFWSGNPNGGETIGSLTPAFSPDGSTVYVINDATESAEYPGGTPLMAFAASVGPASYRHNGTDSQPWNLSRGHMVVGSDGRIIAHSWNDRPYGATDFGTYLSRTFAAAQNLCACYNDPALQEASGTSRVASGGRCGQFAVFSGETGATLFSHLLPSGMDAGATFDPATGRVYQPGGIGSIWIAGFDATGVPLWSSIAMPVHNGSLGSQRAQSGGCLSHDGATFYFQTIAEDATGSLYAIRTSDGSVKWSFPTQSRASERYCSSPVVTPNGVLFVGNNEGSAYYALRDDGATATLLDTLELAPGAIASAAPSLSADGMLYLPIRTVWTTGNGSGESPDFAVHNMLAAIDLREGAATVLPQPGGVRALSGASRITLSWRPLPVSFTELDHYNVYRSDAPSTPIGMAPATAAPAYTDLMAVDGVSYSYAITSVSSSGGESTVVTWIGPRTPRTELDLQVVSVSRSPTYPRYAPEYTASLVTEASGFGPYWFSAATGLGAGQTESTKHLPNGGEIVTYTASVRNRGTLPITGPTPWRWVVDGVPGPTQQFTSPFAPDEVQTTSINRPWSSSPASIRFELLGSDARSANNALEIDSNAVPFLTYMDRSFIEEYRENTPLSYPAALTDDPIDWLNQNITRMNAMFAAAGTPKRMHYGVLEVIEDGAPDPAVDTLPYAIFPFRYYAGQDDPRRSGYYDRAQDIDFGLLHEMGHQLGLVDIYQWDLPSDANEVSGRGFFGPPCLMHGVSQSLSPQSALAMTHWQNTAHGYYGQYLYGIPHICRMRFLASDGGPLANAIVTGYQMVERPGVGKRITNQPKFVLTTDSNGEIELPNVPINSALVPRTFAGDELRDNPFGYVAVVGTNALMHFKIEDRGFTDYAWLDLSEVNEAYYSGQTAEATFSRTTVLGGSIQNYPPSDMAELNASSWSLWTQDGTISALDDLSHTVYGSGSVRIVATGGFDNSARYPADRLAIWDLSGTQNLRMFCYAQNTNSPQFQGPSPWIRLGNSEGYFEYIPQWDILNDSIGQWIELVIPLAGDSFWNRSTHGAPDFSNINYIEIHADTWGYGFTLWLDGVRFDPDFCAPCPADFDMNGGVDGGDLAAFFTDFEAGSTCADVDLNGGIDGGDLATFFVAFEQGGC